MNLEQVIIVPLLTEKSVYLQDIGKRNGTKMVKYSFRIHPDANRQMVKHAIQKIFNVKPDSVNISTYKGKMKKFRGLPAKRPYWKKAIVTFRNGAELEFSKGA